MFPRNCGNVFGYIPLVQLKSRTTSAVPQRELNISQGLEDELKDGFQTAGSCTLLLFSS